jgi:hypothetical protein
MKYLLKLIIGALFMPSLCLAFIIAIVRTLFALVFEFAWEQSGKWHLSMIESIYSFITKLKK